MSRLARAPLRLGLLTSILALVLAARPDPGLSQRRPFRVDDLFELEGVGRYYGGPYAFSADGSKLAFTRVRPKKTLANHKWEFLWDNAGGDVWVQAAAGADPVNVTEGAADGSGWWAPRWSPDGRRVALLSTRGGGVRPWVWNAETGELRRLGVRSVTLVDVHERPYAWADSNRLLVVVLPGDTKPRGMRVELQTPAIASAEWPKVPLGREVTASVLESGVPVDLTERPPSELRLIDTDDGSATTLVSGMVRSWRPSPDGEAVAVARAIAKSTPRAGEPLAFGSYAGEASVVEVVSLDGTPYSFSGDVGRNVLEASLRWSPDGDELAYLAHEEGGARPPLLYRLNLSEGTAIARPLPGVDATPVIRESARLEWTADGALIVQTAEATDEGLPDVTARRDWWLVPEAGEPRIVTEDMETPPRQLWPESGRRAFVGVADGELWRIVPASGEIENLTEDFEPEVSRLSWPAMTNAGTDQYRVPGRTYDQAIFSVQEGTDLSPYLVDLGTGGIRRIREPADAAELVAYEPATRTAIFYSSDRTGLRVWRTDAHGGDVEALVDANGLLRDIAEGELRKIEYTSLDGEPLKGWIILPVGYEPGKRYPLLTWVYAGSVYGDRRPAGYLTSINSSSSLNLQIPAARGYAVLLPSMPLEPEGVTGDPMLRLMNGVMPAVDEVIELGIADPERLFLAGQSFGGYSTYGLITQTDRFAAAVSLAGLSNLISLYGQFDARMRYTDHPHEQLFQMALTESAQIRMGGPPWTDLGRYIRNSPIFSVHRVETPLMIIQGDMDYVAIQQGEEFFMSLYRQGKRAEFVRYWGEGHVLESPANIRDMWRRIFAWFEEFSPEGGDGTE